VRLPDTDLLIDALDDYLLQLRAVDTLN